MKRSKSLRTSAIMAIAALLTMCLIGATFGKYTTNAMSRDGARVANWGFGSEAEMDLSDLFMNSYDHAASNDGADILAPGTSGSATFGFAYDDSVAPAPEVDYVFSVSITESCDDSIKNNPNIRFKLDNGEFGTWDQMVAALKALSGNASGTETYVAGELPDAFGAADTHTIAWEWLFETPGDDAQDALDTAMGNASPLAECQLTVSVTATQID